MAGGKKINRKKGIKYYLNIFPIIEYPKKISKVRIYSEIGYDKLNETIGSIKNLTYYYYQKDLYFLGDHEKLTEALKNNNINYENKIEEIEVDINNDFIILRPLIYKSLRWYFNSRGFIYDFRRKSVVFSSENKFTYNLNNKLYVHEGFNYKLDIIAKKLVLTIFPRIVPTIPVENFENLKEGDEIVFICKFVCNRKGSKCKLYRKKISIKFIEPTEEYRICNNKKEALIKIIDKMDKNYKIPAHTIHREANPRIIRELGVYREFRNISLKPTGKRFDALKKLIERLKNSKKQIKVKIGNEYLIIDTNLPEITV